MEDAEGDLLATYEVPIPWNTEHLILLGHVMSECST